MSRSRDETSEVATDLTDEEAALIADWCRQDGSYRRQVRKHGAGSLAQHARTVLAQAKAAEELELSRGSPPWEAVRVADRNQVRP